jgi:hypothetical protein
LAAVVVVAKAVGIKTPTSKVTFTLAAAVAAAVLLMDRCLLRLAQLIPLRLALEARNQITVAIPHLAPLPLAAVVVVELTEQAVLLAIQLV